MLLLRFFKFLSINTHLFFLFSFLRFDCFPMFSFVVLGVCSKSNNNFYFLRITMKLNHLSFDGFFLTFVMFEESESFWSLPWLMNFFLKLISSIDDMEQLSPIFMLTELLIFIGSVCLVVQENDGTKTKPHFY